MSKLKLTVITVLSLLVVLAPVSSVLAQTEPAEKPINEKSQQTRQKAEENQTSVFEEIENQGGNEVSDKKLDREEGEGLFAGLLTTAVGAVAGAVGGAIEYSIMHAHSWNPRGCALHAAAGAGSAAAATAIVYAAPTP